LGRVEEEGKEIRVPEARKWTSFVILGADSDKGVWNKNRHTKVVKNNDLCRFDSSQLAKRLYKVALLTQNFLGPYVFKHAIPFIYNGMYSARDSGSISFLPRVVGGGSSRSRMIGCQQPIKANRGRREKRHETDGNVKEVKLCDEAVI